MSKAQTLSQVAGRHAATVLRVKAENFDAVWPSREHAHLQQVADFFLSLKNKSQSRWKADFFTGSFFETAGRGPSGAVTAADATSFFGSLSKQEAENENFELSEAYFQLADFCREIANWQKEKNLLRIQMGTDSGTDIKFAEEDFTFQLRREEGFSQLCKFCWRPAVGATGDDLDSVNGSFKRYTKTRCHRHESHAAEENARVDKMQRTPALLQYLIQRGTSKGLVFHDKIFNNLAKDLESMKSSWDNAHADGIVDAVIDRIKILSINDFNENQARKDWGYFFAGFCFALDIDQTATPQDPVYMTSLLFSLLSIKQVKRRDEEAAASIAVARSIAAGGSIAAAGIIPAAGRTTDQTQNIIARAIELEKTGRGWQTRLAKEVGLAQQRISAIWKNHQARLGQVSSQMLDFESGSFVVTFHFNNFLNPSRTFFTAD